MTKIAEREQRNRDMLNARLAGASVETIAARFGLSPQLTDRVLRKTGAGCAVYSGHVRITYVDLDTSWWPR